MTGATDKSGQAADAVIAARTRAQAVREVRLAEALRENLRRRKAQARGRREAEKPDGA